MSSFRRSRWDETAGPMSVASIRALHGAPHRARVSRYVYRAGDRVESVGIASTGYVLEGRVTIADEQGNESFEAGDVVEREAGSYVVMAERDALVVWAWPLLDEARSEPAGES